MTRHDFLASAAAATGLAGASPAPSIESAYELAKPPGTLYGTLTLPSAVRKPPVVLIIAGSGPTDRDGNSGPTLRTDAYRLLAAALKTRGIASVRYDKRGIAASRMAGLSEADIRFETLIDDAVAWLAKLHDDARFGALAIAGHSEGSLIGMLAATRAKVAAFVSLEGAGVPAQQGLRRQLAPQLAALPSLAAASDRILDALAQGHTVADVPDTLQALYRPSVQPYLISWFRYDPRIAIAKVAARTAIVQGTFDAQIPVADARALAAAKPAATLTIVERMSHVLKDAPDATLASQINTVYVNPSLPLDPAVPAAIAAALSL